MLRSLRSKLVLASVLWTAGATNVDPHVFNDGDPRGSERPRNSRRGAGDARRGNDGLRRRRAAAEPDAVRPPAREVSGCAHGQGREDRWRLSQRGAAVDRQNLQPLLEDREKAVKRAIATAGDLAHGLKTPLAVLLQEADRAVAAGNRELADGITQQVDRMSRQVNYQLARARAAASGGANGGRCRVADCTDALVRTVTKLYAARRLEISCNIAADLWARVQREDLDEMLGNLLDNACKWAGSKIVVEASRGAAGLIVSVDDDGPGLPHDLRSVVLERGVRISGCAGFRIGVGDRARSGRVVWRIGLARRFAAGGIVGAGFAGRLCSGGASACSRTLSAGVRRFVAFGPDFGAFRKDLNVRVIAHTDLAGVTGGGTPVPGSGWPAKNESRPGSPLYAHSAASSRPDAGGSARRQSIQESRVFSLTDVVSTLFLKR